MKLSVATITAAFAACALANPADDPADDSTPKDAPELPAIPGLPDISSLTGGLGSLPKLTPEQTEQAKKGFNYFYPECSHECATGALTAAGLDLKKPNPSALCRAGFHDDFLTCAKTKCPAKQFARMQSALKTACYLNTPQCAIPCAFPTPPGGIEGIPGLAGLSGAAGAGEAGRHVRVLAEAPGERPACGPFDLYCSCSEDYSKWYEGCLRSACPNAEDVDHELNTGLSLCASLPPKCARDCSKSALAKANCSPLQDPECACSPKVQSALNKCLAVSSCPLSDKEKALKQYGSTCELTQKLLDSLPEAPAVFQEAGIPLPPAFPTTVPELKDTLKQLQGAAEALLSGIVSPPGAGADAGDADDAGDAGDASDSAPSATEPSAAAPPAAAPPAAAPTAANNATAPASRKTRVLKSMGKLVQKLSEKPTPTQ